MFVCAFMHLRVGVFMFVHACVSARVQACVHACVRMCACVRGADPEFNRTGFIPTEFVIFVLGFVGVWPAISRTRQATLDSTRCDPEIATKQAPTQSV